MGARRSLTLARWEVRFAVCGDAAFGPPWLPHGVGDFVLCDELFYAGPPDDLAYYIESQLVERPETQARLAHGEPFARRRRWGSP